MGDARTILMCMGATKAGTSWAHDTLALHPECHLRTIKEYHYFSLKEPQHWENRLVELDAESAGLAQMPLQDLNPYLARRQQDLQDWRQMIAARQIDAAGFDAFLQQGAPEAAKVVGDFTPAYSILPAKFLAPIAAFGARLRVLYLIRDPLARLWSHIRMSADRMEGGDFAANCTDVLQRVLAGAEGGGIPGITRRGDYASIVPKLQRVFGARLMVIFTEDLFMPAGYARLLQFLGLSPVMPDFDRRVHEGRSLAFPENLRRATLQFLRPQYDFIASEFPALPDVWRRNLSEATL